MIDESASGDNVNTKEWIGSIVDDLDASLRGRGVDVRYGLVGIGDIDEGLPRFAHSQLVDFNPAPGKTAFERLYSSGNHLTDIQTAIAALDEDGGLEDGWDAIDHAIAEYDFRAGAVPVFVLVQNEEGRIELNNSLTRDGVLASLRSKGVILNAMTAGTGFQISNDPPVFDLSRYGLSSEIRVLGVEADLSDGDFLPDGRHTYRWVDTDTINTIADVPGLTRRRPYK